MFAGKRFARAQRTHLLSAARSELFNRVLAVRVRDRSWNRGLEGEVWMLDGSRSVFGPEPWSEALAERLDRFDIHRSEEHTSELQSLMRSSYAVFCLKKKN